jgi:hypothetical protein
MTDGARSPDQERLDALERRIHELEERLRVQEEGGPGPKYRDSGSIHPELDDQTIAP